MKTVILVLCAIPGALVILGVLLPALFESISRKFKLGEWQFRTSLRMVAEAWVKKL